MRKFSPVLVAIAPLLVACGSGPDQTGEPYDVGSDPADPGGQMMPLPGASPSPSTPPPTGTAPPPTEPPPTEPPPTEPPPTEPPPIQPPPTQPPPTAFPLRCSGDASQTAMIGDSYLALTGEVTNFLQGYSGQMYRPYYVSGTQMRGGLPPSIPDQARLAMAMAPVETLIMDGGGNDVLLGDLSCRLTGPAPGSMCEATVLGIVDALNAFFAEMAGAGVREVVFFFYPYLPNAQGLNDTLTYAVPLVQGACENAAGLDCTFVDMRGPFDGHPEYIGFDGIHPTTPGSEVIAQQLWGAMQDNCMNGISY